MVYDVPKNMAAYDLVCSMSVLHWLDSMQQEGDPVAQQVTWVLSLSSAARQVNWPQEQGG